MTIGGRRPDFRFLDASRLDPAVLRRAVDVTCVVLAIALFLRVADPELLLQALWLTVAIGAFLYGLRAALRRIAVATVVMLGYLWVSSAVGVPPTEEQLEFTEWPLMVAIAVIVAVLADRVSTSARRYASLYRQASERLVTAHEEERGRLALDLHDGVGQTLTAVVLTLDAVDRDIRTSDHPSAIALGSVERARDLASTALAETRQVAAQLRPIRVREIGLGAALRNLADSAGVGVELRFEPAILPPGRLAPDLEIDLYRIAQEAIGNAARHSGAQRIWIGGHVIDGIVRLVVADDGVGFDESERDRGLGLDGMRERAAIHGGRVDVQSRRGEGTRVEVLVPLLPSLTLQGLGATGPAIGPAH
jgi:signal transduction histidine kinase